MPSLKNQIVKDVDKEKGNARKMPKRLANACRATASSNPRGDQIIRLAKLASKQLLGQNKRAVKIKIRCEMMLYTCQSKIISFIPSRNRLDGVVKSQSRQKDFVQTTFVFENSSFRNSGKSKSNSILKF